MGFWVGGRGLGRGVGGSGRVFGERWGSSMAHTLKPSILLDPALERPPRTGKAPPRTGKGRLMDFDKFFYVFN